jgi:hypothetical protein
MSMEKTCGILEPESTYDSGGRAVLNREHTLQSESNCNH